MVASALAGIGGNRVDFLAKHGRGFGIGNGFNDGGLQAAARRILNLATGFSWGTTRHGSVYDWHQDNGNLLFNGRTFDGLWCGGVARDGAFLGLLYVLHLLFWRIIHTRICAACSFTNGMMKEQSVNSILEASDKCSSRGYSSRMPL